MECQNNSHPDCNVNENFPNEKSLSKRQLKKLEKRKKWLENKPLRKAKEKLKRKLKIQKAREHGKNFGPSRKVLKSNKMSDSTCKLKVCFDLSLADAMTEEEFSKTFKQLHRCYSINRRASAPLQIYITGYTNSTKEWIEKKFNCFNWDVNFDPKQHHEVFEKESIVYLTSDSPNVIDELDHDKCYIIGALVDHNRLKNICYEKAVKDGVGHAQLPLDLYFKFKTRKVLTIDQVYSLLLRLTEGKTWTEAGLEIFPKRKGVEAINASEESSSQTTLKESDDPDGIEVKKVITNLVETTNESKEISSMTMIESEDPDNAKVKKVTENSV
ncbi:tRNA methyltransferase 10 homolog A [Parasteatoda tepidariorum]|uniref:tRNA methyltransferase 10 homolog A n=1 Tax=Parasteatoda tepidariorum TaxID=114398 RepID=UPI001C720BA9|nr:tRNA methyltransferase 10 homolog A-like [Parasteatoda tepidariorum]